MVIVYELAEHNLFVCVRVCLAVCLSVCHSPTSLLISYFINFTVVCNNYLLTGRNILTTATSVFGRTDPRYIYDPAKVLLNSKEETDGQGHTKIGSWTAGVNDKNQYLQVNN